MKRMNRVKIFGAVLIVGVAAAFITVFADKKLPEKGVVTNTLTTPDAELVDASNQVISEHVGMADYSSDELAEQLKALANEQD